MIVYCLLVLTYKWKSSSLLQRKLLEHIESKQYLLDLTHSQREKIFYQTKKALPIEHNVVYPLFLVKKNAQNDLKIAKK